MDRSSTGACFPTGFDVENGGKYQCKNREDHRSSKVRRPGERDKPAGRFVDVPEKVVVEVDECLVKACVPV